MILVIVILCVTSFLLIFNSFSHAVAWPHNLNFIMIQEKGGLADRIKFVVNIFTIAYVTHRVALVDWPEIFEYYDCPYFDWQLSHSTFVLPAEAVI